VGLVGALACLATRNSDDAGSPSAAFARTAAIGPLTGGLMLVGASGFAGFGFDPAAVFGPILVAVAVFSLLGSHAPALRTSLRRTLVTPFVLAAGGLFWSFVREFIGPGNIAGEIGSSFASDSRGTLAILGFLTVTAAVYYAMLVYAPRQVAEREGGPLEWAARFALFLVGIGLGLAGLAVLGT
jgi:hypothetical protein